MTSIYCLLGLALISMGISLASEQVFSIFGVFVHLVYLCIFPFLCNWCIWFTWVFVYLYIWCIYYVCVFGVFDFLYLYVYR